MSYARPPSAGLLFVGRERETHELREALTRAKGSRGEVWAITGPGGMGKTRLLRWLEEEARGRGFQVRSASCLKESLASFFPFEQIFRRGGRGADGSPGLPSLSPEREGPLPTLLIVEENRPRRFWSRVEAASRAGEGLLVVTRERPATLREARPVLKDSSTILWVTRLEGTDHIGPGALDALGERVEVHLRAKSGNVVALDGLEYLVSQNSFAPVLRLLQFLRDVAEESGGHLITTLNTVALEPREVSLLEADAEVSRDPTPSVGPAAEGGSAGPSAPETTAATLLRYLAELEQAAQRSPQLIVLDDLQWADPQSVSAFQFLARNSGAVGALIVAAFREDGESPTGVVPNGLEEVRDALSREGLLHSIALHGLGPQDTLRLAAALTGSSSIDVLDPSALDRLVRRTEGNPYFLREILSQLVEEGHLRRTSEGVVLDLPAADASERGELLPATVRRLVARRLDGLPPEERACLECASVAGSEFEIAPVAAVLGVPPTLARERLDRLYRSRRLVEPEGERWVCAHPLVWEVTLSEMPSERRRELAGKLGQWWTRNRPEEVDTAARLFHEAGLADLARPYIVRALKEATRRFAVEVSATYLSWLRELRRSSPLPHWDLVGEELRLAYELQGVGNPQLLSDALKALLSEGPPTTLRAEILSDLAWSTRDLSVQESRAYAGQVLELDTSGAGVVPAVSKAQALLTLGYTAAGRQSWREGIAPLQQALDLTRELGPSAVRAAALIQLGYCHMILHEVEDSRGFVDQGLEMARVLSLPALRASGLNTRASLLLRQGDLGGSYADFRAASQEARRAGRVIGVCLSLASAAGVLCYLGDFLRAELLGREAYDTSVKFGIARAESASAWVLGRILLDEGKLTEARKLAQHSLARAREAGREEHEADARVLLAAIEGAAGDPSAALRELEELSSGGEASEIEELADMETWIGRFYLTLRNAEGARRHLDRAGELLAPRQGNAFLEARRLDALAELAALEGRPAAESEGHRARARELRGRIRETWPPEPTGPTGPPLGSSPR